MPRRSAWIVAVLACLAGAALLWGTRDAATTPASRDSEGSERAPMDVPPVRPPTMLAPAPVLSRGNDDGPPDDERGGGTATSGTRTSGSRTPAEGTGLAPDASPGVVALLDGWADAASAHTVGVEPLAKGLPRRIRRRADGGLMVLIPSGVFTMGRGLADARFDAGPDAAPDVQVEISRAYFMDETEVTHAQWARFLASKDGQGVGSGSRDGDGSTPVTGVAFEDARRFAAWVGCSLPTEAQWEWAARASREQAAIWPDDREPDDVAGATGPSGPPRHWTGSFADGPSRVGRYAPVHWGVFDLAGNASELCRDAYAPDFYRRALGIPRVDPVCESEDALVPRVVRGGSWFEDRRDLRVFARSSTARSDARGIGFRCVREVAWRLRVGVPAAEERRRATEDERPR